MSEGLAAHLSDQGINDYRQRTLSPAELLTADDHLATCDVCYVRVGHSDDPEAMFVSVPETPTAATDESDHLSYDQLASYVDGEQDEVEREICDVHLQICKQCSAELSDLKVFKSTMSDSESTVKRAPSTYLSQRFVEFWRRPKHWTPLQMARAAVLPVLVIGVASFIWMIFRSRPTEVSQSTIPAVTWESSPLPPGVAPFERALDSLQAPLTLNDGGGQVTLDKEGNLKGLGDRSHEQLIRIVLIDGHLNLPSELKELSRDAGVLMGGKGKGVSFALLSPVGTFVRTTRPTFHWQSLDGANGYVVNIYDTRFSKVASSPKLSATQWTITSSLEHGALYMWQVTAIKDDVEIKSPVQPAPEARFKILEQTKADELERVKRLHPSSHLVLGTLYAQAGLLDDAEREFRALLAANPKSPIARQLLRRVER